MPQDQDKKLIAQLTAENELLRQKIDQLLKLLKLLYGIKSEKVDPDQIQLLLQGLEPEKPQSPSGDENEGPEGDEKQKPKRKKAKGKNHSRLKGLDQLEVTEETLFPEDYEQHKDQLELIGQDVTEQLDYEPGRLIKRRIIRPKFRRKDDRTKAPLIAPAPAAPLRSGLPTFSLSAELLISKYGDHLPIYRQQTILQRLGLHVPRDTLNHWTLKSLELLQPIAQAIGQEVFSKSYLQLDETPIKELAPGTGKTRTGYVWVAYDPCPRGSVIYQWQSGRSRKDFEGTLGACGDNWSGIFQTDGYVVYTAYEKDHAEDIALGSCMSHIRRGFAKALDAREPGAAQVIHFISYLYQIEEQLRQQKASPALRGAIRASHCAPRLRLLRRYLEQLKSRHLPQSLMGKAITYALGQWSGLDHYLTDGRVELCNNLIENSIRPLKIGAKNYLFMGSRRGGELACVAYTLIENCKRHGLPLRDYLMETMKVLVEYGPGRAAELTPAAVAKARRLRKAA